MVMAADDVKTDQGGNGLPQGRVVAVIGPVIDVDFPPDSAIAERTIMLSRPVWGSAIVSAGSSTLS